MWAFKVFPSQASVTSQKHSLSNNWENIACKLEWWYFHRKQYCWGASIFPAAGCEHMPRSSAHRKLLTMWWSKCWLWKGFNFPFPFPFFVPFMSNSSQGASRNLDERKFVYFYTCNYFYWIIYLKFLFFSTRLAKDSIKLFSINLQYKNNTTKKLNKLIYILGKQ